MLLPILDKYLSIAYHLTSPWGTSVNKTSENLWTHEVYILFIIDFKLLYTQTHALLHRFLYIMRHILYFVGQFKAYSVLISSKIWLLPFSLKLNSWIKFDSIIFSQQWGTTEKLWTRKWNNIHILERGYSSNGVG